MKTAGASSQVSQCRKRGAPRRPIADTTPRTTKTSATRQQNVAAAPSGPPSCTGITDCPAIEIQGTKAPTTSTTPAADTSSALSTVHTVRCALRSPRAQLRLRRCSCRSSGSRSCRPEPSTALTPTAAAGRSVPEPGEEVGLRQVHGDVRHDELVVLVGEVLAGDLLGHRQEGEVLGDLRVVRAQRGDLARHLVGRRDDGGDQLVACDEGEVLGCGVAEGGGAARL